MKAKIKSGGEHLFTMGESNKWNNINDIMIINFIDKYTFVSFKQVKNHLIIELNDGNVDIVFTGETPMLKFSNYCKDQLVLDIIPNKETLKSN